MNKEQQELLDEAYENFVKSIENNRPEGYVRKVITKSEFMKESNFNKDFREYWGLKIEERELSLEERNNVYKRQWEPGVSELSHDRFNSLNIPTKLITITYNDTKLESYE